MIYLISWPPAGAILLVLGLMGSSFQWDFQDLCVLSFIRYIEQRHKFPKFHYTIMVTWSMRLNKVHPKLEMEKFNSYDLSFFDIMSLRARCWSKVNNYQLRRQTKVLLYIKRFSSSEEV